MKFKLTSDGAREIAITDKFNDTLKVARFDDNEALYIGVNENVSVKVSSKKALKLAWAIIDELNPDWAAKF